MVLLLIGISVNRQSRRRQVLHSWHRQQLSSRRLNDNWTTRLEGQWFNSVDVANPLNAYREDSYLQATLARYF